MATSLLIEDRVSGYSEAWAVADLEGSLYKITSFVEV